MVETNLAPHLGPLPDVNDPIIQWNVPERLPPVGCWLVLRIDGSPRYAKRTSFIEKRNRDMEYLLDDGHTISGRFPWTTP